MASTSLKCERLSVVNDCAVNAAVIDPGIKLNLGISGSLPTLYFFDWRIFRISTVDFDSVFFLVRLYTFYLRSIWYKMQNEFRLLERKFLHRSVNVFRGKYK